MSKFSVKIKLKELEIEVEGSHETAPRIAQRVGEQIGALIKPPLLIEMGKNGSQTTDTVDTSEGKTRKKKAGGSGSKASADDVAFTHDPSQHGSPTQEWTTTQKAIWLLWVANSDKPLSGYSIAKAFNKSFKSAKAINNGNVNKGLDKERLKGTSSTVGADTSDGTSRYYLTDAGKTLGAKLAKGETD
ncbi:MAG TPA: PadR family transcriptional regulator [Terriglobales bacterium]|jgi:hypothetical protein|nr:PadR family transcriptional regulator [Terriglobales bacterium]